MFILDGGVVLKADDVLLSDWLVKSRD